MSTLSSLAQHVVRRPQRIALLQQIAEQGYQVAKFKVTDGNCYEIYGKDRDGKKVEIYFNPVDGSVVKSKQG